MNELKFFSQIIPRLSALMNISLVNLVFHALCRNTTSVHPHDIYRESQVNIYTSPSLQSLMRRVIDAWNGPSSEVAELAHSHTHTLPTPISRDPPMTGGSTTFKRRRQTFTTPGDVRRTTYYWPRNFVDQQSFDGGSPLPISAKLRL
jgi:hypothetical protein